jgi:hypothetical protein
LNPNDQIEPDSNQNVESQKQTETQDEIKKEDDPIASSSETSNESHSSFLARVFQKYGMKKLVEKLHQYRPDIDENNLERAIFWYAEDYECLNEEDLKQIEIIRDKVLILNIFL